MPMQIMSVVVLHVQNCKIPFALQVVTISDKWY